MGKTFVFREHFVAKNEESHYNLIKEGCMRTMKRYFQEPREQ